jgi:hypothetical protein
METEAEVVVRECTVTLPGSNERLVPVAAGTVLTYTPLKPQGVGKWEVHVKDGPDWSAVKGGNYVTWMFSRYGDMHLADLDAAFGTEQPQGVGGTWPARPAALWSRLPGRGVKYAKHSGTVKLAEIVQEGGADILVLEAELSYQEEQGHTPLGKTHYRHLTSVTLKVPAGAANGPVHVRHREVTTLTAETPKGRRLNENSTTFTATSTPVSGAKGGG